MKIAFTSKGKRWQSPMNSRFGRTEYILIYNEETDSFSFFDNRGVENQAHGAGPQTAQKLFDLKPDVLITGNGPGRNADAVLKKAGIKIYTNAGEMTVHEAYQAYKKNTLNEF
jgi:predicted Fe-Mo cluster-binding NifX family protein